MTKEQQMLVEKNHNLIYSFLKKYQLSIEEYYDLAAIGLCNAAIFYDRSTAFSTFAYRCMFTSVAREMRKKKFSKYIPQEALVYYQAELENDVGDTCTFLNILPAKENVEEAACCKLLFEDCKAQLNNREKHIFYLLSNGYTQQEISRIVHLSQPQISRIKQKFRRCFAG